MAGAVVDSGDTAFMFLCTALVQFMTPGLAFFYGGLVRSTNILTIMLQSYASIGVVFTLWVTVVFSLCFGDSIGGFVGNPFYFAFWNNVHIHAPMEHDITVPNIPGILFAGYQGMFAVITPALMTGAFADRMRWRAYLIFITTWMIFVYAPVCHWVWGGGWMMKWGVWDFAGGIVVHITSGFSALASLFVIGARNIPDDDPEAQRPHNVPFVALGTAMLWFGWFGFNGGSALTCNGVAVTAAMNSQLAGSVSMIGWLIVETIRGKKPGLVGACVGAVAGLATVTPAAGYIPPWGAWILGMCASVICFACVELVQKSGLDDALDVIGVHGVGGFVGTVLLGVLSRERINPGTASASLDLLFIQTSCAIIVAVYSMVMTYIMLKVIDCIVSLRPPKEYEGAMDLAQHGEQAYVTHQSSENLLPGGMKSDSDLDSETTTTDLDESQLSVRDVRQAGGQEGV